MYIYNMCTELGNNAYDILLAEHSCYRFLS